MTYASFFTGVACVCSAFREAGFEMLWGCEIDPKCREVLAKHGFPMIHHDVTKLPDNLEAPDVLWMSPPCQDLSVAGKRQGLAGVRSGLFYDAINAVRRLREQGRPRFVLMEQVPGLLSSHGGADFRSVLLAFFDIGARDVSWAVLDAQFFGVPQRRRRLFFVADFGGECAREVLALAESLRGDFATSGKAGQETSSNTASGAGISRLSGTLGASCAGLSRPAGNCNETDFLVAAPLRSRGYQNGSPERSDITLVIAFDERQITSKTNRSNPKPGNPSYTLTADAPSICTPIKEATSNNPNTDTPCGAGIGNNGDPMYCLSATASNMHGVFCASDYKKMTFERADLSQPLTGSADRTRGAPISVHGYSVRRLTPTECERLQGLPDGWTDGHSDSTRYKMIGNGVAKPCAAWLANGVKAQLLRGGRVEAGR